MYQSQSQTYVCMTLSQVNSGNMMSSTIQLTIPEIKLDQTGDIFGPFQSLEKTLTPKIQRLFAGTYQCSVLRRCHPPPKKTKEGSEEESVAITKSLYMKVESTSRERS